MSRFRVFMGKEKAVAEARALPISVGKSWFDDNADQKQTR